MNSIFNKLNLINIIFASLFFFIGLFYLFYTYPFEDALILFRYVKNLSEFFEIAFNKGDQPVEGSTDFLWMIFLSILNFFKIDPAIGALILNSISFFIIINIITKKIIYNFNIYYLFFFLLLFLNIGSLINPSIGGFSTISFCALGLLVYLFAIENKIFKWSIFSVIFCLFRPEAVIFFIFSIPLLFINLDKIDLKKFIFSLIFIITIGVIYNIFRYLYFADIIPITLQIKSIGGDFSIKRIFAVVSQIASTFFISMILFVFLSFFILFKNKLFNKYEIIVFLLINIALFVYLILISKSYLSQNIYYRYFSHFHFIYFIITIYIFNKIYKFYLFNLLFVIILFLGSLDQSNLLQRILNITNINISTPSYKIINNFNFEKKQKPLVSISQTLKKQKEEYRLIITEAGHIPYISEKYSIDIAGLNTYEFSKRPVNCSDFDNLNPDLIEFDIGLLDYFNYTNLINDESFPTCGIISKKTFYNKPKIFNYDKIKFIDNYNYHKKDKHKNATVVVAPNNALYCLKDNKNFDQVFINKFSDQIYILSNKKNIDKVILDSCYFNSSGYILDNLID